MIALGAVSACSSLKNKQETSGSLEGNQWMLTEVAGRDVSADSAYIEFGKEPGQLGGKGGCNGFGGKYTAEGSQLKMENIFSTKMACDKLDTENAFFNALENTSRFSISDQKLELYAGDELLATLEASSTK